MASTIRYLSERELDEAITKLIEEVNEDDNGPIDDLSSGEYLFTYICLEFIAQMYLCLYVCFQNPCLFVFCCSYILLIFM